MFILWQLLMRSLSREAERGLRNAFLHFLALLLIETMLEAHSVALTAT